MRLEIETILSIISSIDCSCETPIKTPSASQANPG